MAIWLAFAGAAHAASRPDSAATRVRSLSPGINLADLYFRPDKAPAPLIDAVAAAGFRHARLPVSPATLITEDHPEVLRPDGVKRLDAILDLLQKRRIAVSVEMHGPDPRLWTDPAYGEKFASFWEALARHLSARDPKSLFLEVVNEPTCDTPEYWNALQGKILAAMRRGAPRHTLVATGNMQTSAGHWDQVAALRTLSPYADPNVIYTFHYYNAFWFTHQSATWAGDVIKDVLHVPYPSSPEAVAGVLAEQGSPEARDMVRGYGEERWNAAKIRSDLKPFKDWARRHKAVLYCGELGVYKAMSAEPDRLRWYRDVLAALKADGIPWTIWDDGGGFGVFAPREDAWQADVPLLGALGLRKR
jgi:hypothetical protein